MQSVSSILSDIDILNLCISDVCVDKNRLFKPLLWLPARAFQLGKSQISCILKVVVSCEAFLQLWSEFCPISIDFQHHDVDWNIAGEACRQDSQKASHEPLNYCLGFYGINAHAKAFTKRMLPLAHRSFSQLSNCIKLLHLHLSISVHVTL